MAVLMITPQEMAIIDQVMQAVNQWQNFAEQAGVSKQQNKWIAKNLNDLNKHLNNKKCFSKS